MDNVFLADTRVYIAGILFPALEISITSTIGQPPSATFTVPADYRLYNVGLNDRVPVLIFQKESYVGSENYILLFEGFITDRLYLNTALQRNITFNAVSIFDILNDVRVRYITGLTDMVKEVTAGNEYKALPGIPTAIPYPLFLFLHGLGAPKARKPGVEDQSINYPYEFLDNIYRFIGGNQVQLDWEGNVIEDFPELQQERKSSELADYFARMAKYYQLSRRFIKIPYYDEQEGQGAKKHTDVWDGEENPKGFPILKGIQDKQTAEVLSGHVNQQAPDTQTTMDVIQQIAAPMDFELAVLSSPPYISGDPDQKDYYHNKSRLVSTVLKPAFSDTIPPMCNVIFRSQVREINSHVQFKGMPTRIQVNDVNSPVNLMEEQAQGDNDLLLELYMTTMYPMRNIKETAIEDYARNKVAMYILDTEEYTGPWIQEVTTPPWWNWTDALKGSKGDYGYTTPSGKAIPAEVVVRHILDHRQLLMARYLRRKLTVQMTFDPYIIAGFPGVVFDAEETGLSFAGYVTTVNHVISTNSMETTVEFGYVRELSEAKDAALVHPAEFLQDLLQDPQKMTEIYEGILGGAFEFPNNAKAENEARKSEEKAAEANNAGNASNPTKQEGNDKLAQAAAEKKKNAAEQGKAASQVTAGSGVLKSLFDYKPIFGFKGVRAYSYGDLFDKYMQGNDERDDPNKNPSAAYALQRRNICTFDQFLEFSGLTSENGKGPAGEEVPLYINGEYMENRHKVKIYIREKKEEEKRNDKKAAEQSKADAAAQAGQGKPAAGNQGDAKPNETPPKLNPQRETRDEMVVKDSKYKIVEKEADLRDVLKAVSKELFSKQIYA